MIGILLNNLVEEGSCCHGENTSGEHEWRKRDEEFELRPGTNCEKRRIPRRKFHTLGHGAIYLTLLRRLLHNRV